MLTNQAGIDLRTGSSVSLESEFAGFAADESSGTRQRGMEPAGDAGSEGFAVLLGAGAEPIESDVTTFRVAAGMAAGLGAVTTRLTTGGSLLRWDSLRRWGSPRLGGSTLAGTSLRTGGRVDRVAGGGGDGGAEGLMGGSGGGFAALGGAGGNPDEKSSEG